MIQDTSIESEEDSPQVLKGCVWALVTSGTLIVFVMTAWLGTQRVQVLLAQSRQRQAEERASAVEKERDTIRSERNETVRALNEKLAKTETAKRIAEQEARTSAANVARLVAEKEARSAAANAAKPEASVPRAETIAPPLASQPVKPLAPPGPSIQALAGFIEQHLLNLTGPVEAQLPDYAADVEFHNLPHASLRAIENDRRQWVQRFPVRQIFEATKPRIDVIQVPGGGWLATATFDWRWQYRSRSGAALTGMTRDTWKIIPSPQGFKIVSEHSADPVTGQSKD